MLLFAEERIRERSEAVVQPAKPEHQSVLLAKHIQQDRFAGGINSQGLISRSELGDGGPVKESVLLCFKADAKKPVVLVEALGFREKLVSCMRIAVLVLWPNTSVGKAYL